VRNILNNKFDLYSIETRNWKLETGNYPGGAPSFDHCRNSSPLLLSGILLAPYSQHYAPLRINTTLKTYRGTAFYLLSSNPLV
jgi:hypothetical protein